MSKKAKMHKPTLLKHKKLIQRLKTFQANLCFSKTVITKGLKAHLVKMRKEGSLGDLASTDDQTFLNTTETMIRNMCRHVGEAQRKGPDSKFIKKMNDENSGDSQNANKSGFGKTQCQTKHMSRPGVVQESSKRTGVRFSISQDCRSCNF